VNARADSAIPRTSDALRDHARAVFDAAVAAVDPRRAVRGSLRLAGSTLRAGPVRLALRRRGRLLAVAVGKAAAPMLAAAEEALGARLEASLGVTKRGHGAPLRGRLLEAGHPVPDEAGLAAAAEVERLAAGLGPDDVLLVLLSGGGSALLPAPADGIALAAKQEVTGLLLASGADIGELNAVRKHLSRLKGGGLARLAAPARVLTLVLSDVAGDAVDVVASGPTVPDPTTFSEALAVLDRRRLRERVPAPVRQRLEAGAAGRVPETPKPGDPLFARCRHVVVGSNRIAVAEAARAARRLGYRPLVLTTTAGGEARDLGGFLAALAREVRSAGAPLPPPCCLLAGGEPTVTLRGPGRGGRCQEAGLAAALGLAGLGATVVLCGGTDGTDGPTDAAGGIVDGGTVARARAAGLDPRRHLDENDAYPLLAAAGDLLVTGPTRTNVMDLFLVLAGGRAGAHRRSRSRRR
jgi:hydroxypyruvate reductase